MEFLASILGYIKSAEGASLTVAVVLEFVFRLFPSKKPLSIIRLVASFAKIVGDILIKISDLSDKVLPQVVKEESLLK